MSDKPKQVVRITAIDEGKMSRCWRCANPIIWATTVNAKKMPLQPDAVSRYVGAPLRDEATGKDYWPVPAELTHFPHCTR